VPRRLKLDPWRVRLILKTEDDVANCLLDCTDNPAHARAVLERAIAARAPAKRRRGKQPIMFDNLLVFEARDRWQPGMSRDEALLSVIDFFLRPPDEYSDNAHQRELMLRRLQRKARKLWPESERQ
jgi:hypothetical protein